MHKLSVNNRETPTFLRMRDCTISEGVIGDKVHLLYKCTKLDDLRTIYRSSCNKFSLNVHNFIHICQTKLMALQNLS